MCSNSAIFGQQFDCISDLLVAQYSRKSTKKGANIFTMLG